MLFKTIVLELIQGEHPTLHEGLRAKRQLLEAVNTFAAHLKSRHEFWMKDLGQRRMGTDTSQLSSSALEIAVQEFRDALPPEMSFDEEEIPNLDDAMNFFTRRGFYERLNQHEMLKTF